MLSYRNYPSPDWVLAHLQLQVKRTPRCISILREALIMSLAAVFNCHMCGVTSAVSTSQYPSGR